MAVTEETVESVTGSVLVGTRGDGQGFKSNSKCSDTDREGKAHATLDATKA